MSTGTASHAPDLPPGMCLRQARADDAPIAVPLIYASGPAAFDYVFATGDGPPALEFLHQAFVDGAGEFGYRNHFVLERDGRVLAIGAAYSARDGGRFFLAAVRQIAACYGWRLPAVALRGLCVERVIPPPQQPEQCYLAHLAVLPELRGQGLGALLCEQLFAYGRGAGFTHFALDVSVANPRAQALYQRLGFIVTRERVSRLANRHGAVANHRRMERAA